MMGLVASIVNWEGYYPGDANNYIIDLQRAQV